ncbi:MAG: iron-sulfur cluster assembly scaffold protein [Spirochaeta sp.]|jgi:nitrogen fixation NifU-like protein|nr:iron-sulfur cluster assembly scaffold protein [Spirochaeta sp.]
MLDDALRETLFAYARSPRNGSLSEDYTHSAVSTNSGCGDRVELRLTVIDDRIIVSSFAVEGCALCTASAALLDDLIVGMRTTTAEPIGPLFAAALETDPDREVTEWPMGLEELAIFDPIRANPARRGCVLLPWEALNAALASEQIE